MSILYIGRLRTKADKIGAAAPEIAAGFQQAGNSLIQYDQIRQERMQQEMLKASVVAKINGGWGNTDQEFKNKLPRIFGMDFPTDPEGNVKIDPTYEELIHRTMTTRMQEDPEFANESAMIDMGLMNKAPNPAEVELLKQEAQNDLLLEDKKDQRWWERENWKEDNRTIRDEQNHLQRLGEIAYRNRSSPKGKAASEPSGIYEDADGKLLSTSEKVAKYGDDMPAGVRLLSNKEFENTHKVQTFRSEDAARGSIARKRDIDRAKAVDVLVRSGASNPAVMGLLDTIRAKRQGGVDYSYEMKQLKAMQTQEQMDAGVTDLVEGSSLIDQLFGEDSSVDKIFGEIAKKRTQGMSTPDQVTPEAAPASGAKFLGFE